MYLTKTSGQKLLEHERKFVGFLKKNSSGFIASTATPVVAFQMLKCLPPLTVIVLCGSSAKYLTMKTFRVSLEIRP